MPAGRKPKPTQLRELHGNPSHTAKRSEAEPIPAGALDDAPSWFDDDQRASWRYALDNSPPGLLRRLDRAMLTVWVVAECAHAKAAQELREGGLVVRYQGVATPINNPFLGVMNRQALILIKVASEMGFSPASRARVYANATLGGMPAMATMGGGDRPKGKGRAQKEPLSLDDFLASAPDAPVMH